MTLARTLSSFGVRCLLVERNPTTTRHPKMDITNGRSMELFRRLGLVDKLRAVAVPEENNFDISWITSLTGRELHRFRYPSVVEKRAEIRARNDGTQPREPAMRVSQVDDRARAARRHPERSAGRRALGRGLRGFPAGRARASPRPCAAWRPARPRPCAATSSPAATAAPAPCARGSASAWRAAPRSRTASWSISAPTRATSCRRSASPGTTRAPRARSSRRTTRRSGPCRRACRRPPIPPTSIRTSCSTISPAKALRARSWSPIPGSPISCWPSATRAAASSSPATPRTSTSRPAATA